MKSKCEREALFELRWYRLKAINADPDTSVVFSEVSTAPTQCETILSPVQRGASIVRIGINILKTISFYCRVCSNCILRDKGSEQIIGEYCKRVILY